MKLSRNLLTTGAVLGLAAAAGVFAHVRLQHPVNLNKLFWSLPSNISIVINNVGSDDIADGSHVTAVRNAIDEWNKATGTTVNLVENVDPVQMARTDWQGDDIHLILWDETNASGFFGGSGTVAVTPVFFFNDGRIADADILYNGGDFQFTTEGAGGRYDVQDVGTHELGHLIGFDHSGWAGATMYPFVDPTVIAHRSLSDDDLTGLRTAYPMGTFGSITGTVRRIADNSVIAGAHVVALGSDGRPKSAAITDTLGGFVLGGLVADTYTVYANPLDEPVDAANLGAGNTVETDFEATVHGVAQVVTAGAATGLGNLITDADVTSVLGSELDAYPISAVQGVVTPMLIRGSNLVPGSTLTASDPSVTIGASVFTTSQVTFNCTLGAMEEVGHFDLIATTPGGDVSILTAPIEVVPADPTVTLVSPNSGSDTGGTAVTITGTGFRAGDRVVIGDTIYVDGQPGGAIVVDANTITLTTAAMVGGIHDVVVIDETGVEGRDANAFQSLAVPTLGSAFPSAGNVAGSTRIMLRGTNFAVGAVVRINSVQQTVVNFIDSTRLEIITDAAATGGPFSIEVENPGPSIAMLAGAYTFVAKPDPNLTTVTPPTATAGQVVTLTGVNFDATMEVFFGANVDTGLGGVSANSLNFVDANTIEAEVPALAGGLTNVLVSDPGTGQAGILPAAITVLGDSSSGGGCYTRSLAPPFDPTDMFLGGGWILFLLVLFQYRVWRHRRSERAPRAEA